MSKDDLNRPETEEDGLRAGALRRLKALQQLPGLPARPPAPSPSDPADGRSPEFAPSKFQQLASRMASTGQFPTDLQPISPLPPSRPADKDQ